MRAPAEKNGVGFSVAGFDFQPVSIREVLFIDTDDFRLYNNAFILRRRMPYKDGFPIGDPEIVFKFRHSDLQVAAEDGRSAEHYGDHRVKFKCQALPLKEKLGGIRLLYSHNVQFLRSAVGRSSSGTRPGKEDAERGNSPGYQQHCRGGSSGHRRTRLRPGHYVQGQRSDLAHARRTPPPHRRVCLPVPLPGSRAARKGSLEACRSILHCTSICGRRLCRTERDEDRRCLPVAGQFAQITRIIARLHSS